MKYPIETIRHSLAHVLAAAVLELRPEAKLGIGPAIENGFYYDFDNIKITAEDLPKIEKNMREIIAKDLKFTKKEIPIMEAKKIFKGQPYKLELIEELQKNKEPITIYETSNS